MALIVEDKSVTHEGLVMAVARCMGVFYEDGGMIVSRDPECLKRSINILIELFRRVVLMANVAKSNTMTCQSGLIFTGVSDEAFGQRSKV